MKTNIINAGLKFMSVDDKLFYVFLKTSPKHLHPIVINVITDEIFKNFITVIKKNKSYVKYGKIYNGKINNIPISIIKTDIGAPNAAILMELLHRSKKCKVVIRTEVCGSISNQVNIGDVFIPKHALSGEGTTNYYLRKYGDSIHLKNLDSSKIEVNSKFYSEIMKKSTQILPEISKMIKTGDVWTTDAIFCETPEEISIWKTKGAQIVDMETSIMFLLAKLFQIPTIAILGVIDKPGSTDYDFTISNKMHPDIVNSVKRATKLTLKLIIHIKSLIDSN
jgi:nucleoside phosphorylase